MIRTVLAGLLGGLALYVAGFFFWGTPLSGIAFTGIDEARSAAVQTVLAQTLTEGGTGTYVVPDPSTQQGTTLFGKGPIATVHFNSGGFPVVDSAALFTGFILALIVGLLMAVALTPVARLMPAFGARARLVVIGIGAVLAWVHLGQPVFNHFGWRYFIYLFVSDFVGFVACGLVIAKLLPAASVVRPAEA